MLDAEGGLWTSSGAEELVSGMAKHKVQIGLRTQALKPKP